MILLKITVWLSLAILNCFVNGTVIPKSIHDPKIVGGLQANMGQFPYQVFIIVEVGGKTKLCGGSIISEDFILTAAHCGKEATVPSDIWIGAADLMISREPRIRNSVKEIIIHEKYSTGMNDIALLRVEEKFDLTNREISKIDLQSSTVNAGVSCTVSGWGDTTWEGNTSNVLLFTHVPIVDNAECSQKNKLKITDDQICAGGISGSCQGDSGGPLVCDHLLTGIVSRGVRCGDSEKPGIYTNVAYFKDWIEEKMKMKSNSMTVLGNMLLLLAAIAVILTIR